MSDWELDKTPQSSQKEQYELSQPNEPFIQSVGMAPFRIAKDIALSVGRGISHIPEYYQKSLTEVPGLFSLSEHPEHAIGQAIAGASELQQGLRNIPHDLSEYASQRLHLLPENISNKVPYFEENNIAKAFGNPAYSGEALLRGSVRNIASILPSMKAAQVLNPLKLTNKNIIKDILNKRNEVITEYSGPQGRYQTLFNEAYQSGARPDLNVNPNNIDFKKIGINRIKNNYEAINNLRLGRSFSLEDYQEAIKELGIIEREMMNTKKIKGTLTNKQDNRLKESQNAIEYIQDNMFKDNQRRLISHYLNEHKKIQKGYATEVMPYKNPAIENFLNKKITDKELIQKLSKGEFAAKVGNQHLIGTRKKIKNTIKVGGGLLIGHYGLGQLKKYLSGE